MRIGKRAVLVIGAVAATVALTGGGIAIASDATAPTPPMTFYPHGNNPSSATSTTTSHERAHDDSRDDDQTHETSQATTPNAHREHDDSQSE
ncbi:hypothetical protein [Actinocrinis sp.]|uniref:hypothetical protein n=1 Tax=Actinocrinis sp. TaxID=1920516 RepID=UPI002D5E79F1|nr:hypothetical protein [Actinocrinis sp.]HZP54588.1 hypothetical protein [Actinocrinis sp.]